MIEMKNVTKRFGSLVAVDQLSLEIGPGELFGFIGPNGAGKSTTMKILACLMRADSGEARVAGFDPMTDGQQIRRAIGYMPDFLGVYDDLTVDEYLQFFASAFRIPRKKRASVIDSVLELTDLTDKRHALVDSLSRGMSQRLGVARVLIHEPKVLLLDEPASGLDPRARIEMRTLLAELGRMGKCLMVSSHILSELAEMCTSIGIIEQGKLLYAGSIDDAYARVGAGKRLGVRFEAGTDLAAARALIERDARVAAVEEDGNGEAKRRLLVDLVPADPPPRHSFLLETLVGAGYRIVAFSPLEVKLEDAFLSLTKGHVQ